MFENWYAVQVRSGKEDEVIRACDILIDQDVYQECFIPRCKRMKKFRGEWKQVDDILFKGYVFMITDYVDDLYTQLKKVPDLTKLLGNDGETIYPIYKEEAMFLSQFGGQKHIIDISIGYIEGDTIKVTSGPLMGMEGLIRKIDRHKRVAFIEVSLFGQSRIVQIALEIIKKI